MAHGDAQRRGGELGPDATRFDEQVAEAIGAGAGDVDADEVVVDSTLLAGVGTDLQTVLEEIDADLVQAQTDISDVELAADTHSSLGPSNNGGRPHGINFVDEQQTVTITNGSAAEQYKLKFAGQAPETVAINWDATSAELEPIVQLLADTVYPDVDLTVTIAGDDPHVITFEGAYDVAALEEGAQVGADTVTVGVVVDVEGGVITVTGLRDEPESALANLLTALETLGLITDATAAT